MKTISRFLAWLLLLGLVLVCPWSARADYAPPSPFNYSKGTSTPQVGVLIHSGAATLGGLVAWNASGGTAYLMAFDATSQPSTGTAPIWQSASCATTAFCATAANVPAGGIRVTTGLYVAFSSTGPTYTQAAGASTGAYIVTWR